LFHTHFLFLMFAAISENTKCQMKVEDFLVKTRGFYSRTENSSQTSWQERLLVNAKYDHFIFDIANYQHRHRKVLLLHIITCCTELKETI